MTLLPFGAWERHSKTPLAFSPTSRYNGCCPGGIFRRLKFPLEKGGLLLSSAGYIRDELDLKLLVLYIMSHTAGPITFLQLLDLALCDAGVDYFSLTQAVEHMVETGQLSLENDRYSITEKGRRNSEICQSSLPYSVRMHCDENLVKVNEALRREAQVQAQTQENEDGTCTLHLSFHDAGGPLLNLQLLVPDRVQAAAMAARFQADPAAVYHTIVSLLTQPNSKEDSSHEKI